MGEKEVMEREAVAVVAVAAVMEVMEGAIVAVQAVQAVMVTGLLCRCTLLLLERQRGVGRWCRSTSNQCHSWEIH